MVGPQPQLDRLAGTEVEGAERAFRVDAVEHLGHDLGVAREDPRFVLLALPIPREPVPRQLLDGQQREAFVVRLEQPAVPVQQPIGPLAPVARDARQKHQVVVTACHLEWVELDRSEPLEDRHDARRLCRQRTRWIKQVTADEEASGGLAGDTKLRFVGRTGHPVMVGKGRMTPVRK